MVYRYSEYLADEKEIIISIIIIIFEIKNEDIIIMISPKIFNLGGRAMFILIAIIHISELYGEILIAPLSSIIFRLLIFSYSKLDKKNI